MIKRNAKIVPKNPLQKIYVVNAEFGFYQVENDNETFIEEYFNCFKNPEGYYLD